MEIALWLVGGVLCIVVVAAVCDRIGWPPPLVLVVIGVLLSVAPFIPEYEFNPEVVLLGILPPLLYSAAYNTSFIDFRNKKGTIASLSVGLVIATTLTVGLVTWWLLPGVPLAAALALGAVVAPPDAVAATAIARRVGMPRGIVQVLEGESLVNDATALTALRTALAALAGAITIAEVGVDFLVAAGGGTVIGLLVGALVLQLLRLVGNLSVDLAPATAATFVVPYLAYLPAEAVHSSGVISVVVAGLLIGHQQPRSASGSQRLMSQGNWQMVAFLLENGVFLLIGLELYGILSGAASGDVAAATIAVLCVAAFAVAVLTRFAWVYATALLAWLPWWGGHGTSPRWREQTVVGWAGMRGVVTLAAALILPLDVAHREVLIVVALFVVLASLLLQGSTLPWLVRRLRLPAPDDHELALQEAALLDRAANAGLATLGEGAGDAVPPAVLDRLRARMADRRNAMWERAALIGDRETPTQAYIRMRMQMLAAERAEILSARDQGEYDDEVIRRAMRRQDLEEAILDQPWTPHSERDADLTPTAKSAGTCNHLQDTPQQPPPRELLCEGCVAEGTTWVRLRMCLACGYRGCCDSSQGRHSEGHHLATGHPVMRSIEPGEAWRWCYVHEVLGR